MLNSDAGAIAEASSKYGPMIIQDKLRQLAAYERAALLQFPRTERHSICQDIRMTTRNIQRLISRCKKRYYKKTTLEDIDVELDLLRELVAESYESKYINVHKYEVWSRKINEIGKMVGGLIKALRASR
jgi:hypothetical protein